MVVEVLLGVGRFDVDRSAEMTMFNMDIDIQKSDMGGGSVPGEVDGILTVDLIIIIIIRSRVPGYGGRVLDVRLQCSRSFSGGHSME